MKKINNKRIYYIFAFVFILLINIWKCRYGYPFGTDEAFYPTITYRFIQGDDILYDEWYTTQLYNVLLIPFVKFYTTMIGSEGIYLFFRYMYVLFNSFVALFIYYKLKRINIFAGGIASLLYFLFVPHNIMTLSYITIGIGGLICSLLLLMNKEKSNKSKIQAFLAGIFLSISTLCIPYAALLYVVYIVAVIIKTKKKKEHEEISSIVDVFYSRQSLLYLTLGIIVSIVAFSVYVFTHSSLTGIIQSLPYILSDPDHCSKSFYSYTLAYFVRILIGNHHNWYSFMIYCIMGMTMLIYLKKNNKVGREKYIIIQVVLTIILSIVLYMKGNSVDNVLYVVNVLIITLLPVYMCDEKSMTIFYCIIIPGIVYTYCEYCASNQGFAIISMSSCVAGIGSVFIVCRLLAQYHEIRGHRYSTWTLFSLGFFMCIIIGMLICYRVNGIYWDEDGVRNQNCLITEGPNKGLYVNNETYQYYNDIYEDTKELRNMDKDTKVVYVSDTSLYMAGKQRCGAYSTFIYGVFESDLLRAYYEQHPDKVAQYIYIDVEHGGKKGENVYKLAEDLGMNVTTKNHGWILYADKEE